MPLARLRVSFGGGMQGGLEEAAREGGARGAGRRRTDGGRCRPGEGAPNREFSTIAARRERLRTDASGRWGQR